MSNPPSGLFTTPACSRTLYQKQWDTPWVSRDFPVTCYQPESMLYYRARYSIAFIRISNSFQPRLCRISWRVVTHLDSLEDIPLYLLRDTRMSLWWTLDLTLLELLGSRTTEHNHLKSSKIPEAVREAHALLKDELLSTTKAMELEPSLSKYFHPIYELVCPTKDIRTHKSNFATIKPWFCREPLPHEGASRTVVHRINKASDVIIDWILAHQSLE